jgi:hypothetical protein
LSPFPENESLRHSFVQHVRLQQLLYCGTRDESIDRGRELFTTRCIEAGHRIRGTAMFDVLAEVFGDSSTMMLGLLVFLATAVLTFGVMLGVRSRGAIKRRAAGIAEYSGDAHDSSALRNSSLKAVQRLLIRRQMRWGRRRGAAGRNS